MVEFPFNDEILFFFSVQDEEAFCSDVLLIALDFQGMIVSFT